MDFLWCLCMYMYSGKLRFVYAYLDKSSRKNVRQKDAGRLSYSIVLCPIKISDYCIHILVLCVFFSSVNVYIFVSDGKILFQKKQPLKGL